MPHGIPGVSKLIFPTLVGLRLRSVPENTTTLLLPNFPLPTAAFATPDQLPQLGCRNCP